MVYRPPFLLPFGSDGRPPASVSATIDASPAWWAATSAPPPPSPFSIDPAAVIDFNDPGTAVAEAATLASGSSQPSVAGSGDDAATAADKIMVGYGSQIRQFVGAQRQACELSELPIHRRVATFPGLDVFYMVQQGRETIKYVVRPESTQSGGATPPALIDLGAIAVEFFNGAS